MGRWLKKATKFIDKVADQTGIGNSSGSGVSGSSLGQQLVQAVSDVDYGQAVTKLKGIAQRTETAARETREICVSTATKRQDMIAFADEIMSTLQKLPQADGGGASSLLDTIKELTDGEKVLAAKELASGLDTAAKSCVTKSIEMIDAMDEGVDSLPQVLQDMIEKEDDKVDDKDQIDVNLLKDVEQDLVDVKICITSIQSLNLVTGLQVGLQAFTQLSEKAKRSRSLFDQVSDYAGNIIDITKAFHKLQINSVVSKAKQLLHCLRMTDIMKQLAQAAGRLLEMIIELFQHLAERISKLWAALAFAKDCMQDCLVHVKEAQEFCAAAKEKSINLLNKSMAIKGELDSVGDINMKSIQSVRQLASGGDIQEAIDMAKNMDDLVLDCSSKTTDMVDRVGKGLRISPRFSPRALNPVRLANKSRTQSLLM